MVKCKGVISAGDKLTAEAGSEILKAGGNAFDAAISATFMSFAASSSITSAGGGGFFLAHQSDNSNVLYDFFVQTPRNKRIDSELDFYPVHVDFGDKIQEFHIGWGSVATPGNIAGLFQVHQDLGSMPMVEIMAPVLELMKSGIKLHQQTKYQLDILEPILTLSQEGREIYQKEDQLLKLSESYHLPQMMDTFDYLARHGNREFYEGEIAQMISKLCIENGGSLTYDDFKEYKVSKRIPLKNDYRGSMLITNPPPNAGGSLITFLLKLFEKVKFTKAEWGSAKHLQALAEAIMLTGVARNTKLEENLYAHAASSLLFEPDFLSSMQQTMLREMHKSGNTTHVSVIDKAGNIASCTTSVGEGCGHYIPNTNIMLNNMLGEEDLNKKGFHHWLPDQRMSSMMSPSIVMNKDGSKMGLGSGGSNRIRSAIAQAIINFIDFELMPDDIVNKPRIHLEHEHMDFEPGYLQQHIDAVVLPEGINKFQWSEKNMYFGGVHAVFMDQKGNMDGAGDRRRVGHVISF